MNFRYLFAFLFLLLPMGSGSLLAADGAKEAEEAAPIRRFHKVAPDLYRGGQPDEKGFAFLRDLGVRTVVSFRNDVSERATVEGLGMRWVNIPLTFRPFSTAVSDEAVALFFATLDDPESGPVFFHCQRGADRTGTFAALHRILRQGWTVDRAYDEARDIGMRWWYYPVKSRLSALAKTLAPSSATTTPALAQ